MLTPTSRVRAYLYSTRSYIEAGEADAARCFGRYLATAGIDLVVGHRRRERNGRRAALDVESGRTVPHAPTVKAVKALCALAARTRGGASRRPRGRWSGS